MNAFEVSQILATQGADRDTLALVLESLHNEQLLPTWGPGATGAELSTREVVSIILSATAAQPKDAAQHVISVAALIRHDGRSLGEILSKIMESEPATIAVKELTVSADGQCATIRYPNSATDVFYTNGGQKAFRHACIIRGSVLTAIAMKMNFETAGGWAEKK